MRKESLPRADSAVDLLSPSMKVPGELAMARVDPRTLGDLKSGCKGRSCLFVDISYNEMLSSTDELFDTVGNR
jgi:hypothetical protein